MLVNKSYQIIVESIKEMNETLNNPLPVEEGLGCYIYGGTEGIDSISLVSLIVNIEQKIEDSLGASIILANEKAMSRKNSPFLNLGSLSEYVEELLSEAHHG